MYRISEGKSRQNQVLFPLIIIFERRGGRIISFWEFNDNSLTYIFLTKVVFVHFLALSSLAHCVGFYRRILVAASCCSIDASLRVFFTQFASFDFKRVKKLPLSKVERGDEKRGEGTTKGFTSECREFPTYFCRVTRQQVILITIHRVRKSF